jgi:AcrR family transcriptional regulator
MKTAKTKKSEESAEQKIIEAARKLFTEKSFDAVKTRDIANEAGINLALLNYYFRSKEKLFEIVMQENMQKFFQSIVGIINDEETTIKEKVELLVNRYIDMLLNSPELPIFVMSNIKNSTRTQFQGRFRDSFLMKQVQKAIKKGKMPDMNPVNFMLNVVSLTIFPFIGKPMIKNSHNMDDKQFLELIEERRKLVPKWIEAMMKLK